MRTKKLILNTIFSLFEELVAIICSFILPKLILSHFGSEYNGLVTSITQFLSCAILFRAGIGGATKAALYKPLANNDKEEIDAVINATNNYMRKVGIILGIFILLFAIFYPSIIHTEFSWLFTFSLFVIIGISTFAESFFGITYLILLQADQKLYISSMFKIISYIVNVILASILILSGKSIHVVKLGSAVAFCIYPLALNIYVKKKYNINSDVKPNNAAIVQRWDAFWHQIAVFVNNNTDIMVLTVFTNMFEVSVYSVYQLIVGGLKRFITSFTQGIDAAFGNMLAKNETKELEKNLSVVEFIIYNLSTFIFTCAIILVLHFVKIYTHGVTDVDYLRPMFAYILLAAQFFAAIRMPYQHVIQAAGHFKQTKKYAIVEAILNIVISIILVIKFGLIGVSIGTFFAVVYKTIAFSNYMADNIVHRSKFILFKKSIISICEFTVICCINHLINFNMQINYLNWILNSVIVAFVSIIVISIGTYIFYKNEFNDLISKLKNLKRVGRKKYEKQ